MIFRYKKSFLKDLKKMNMSQRKQVHERLELFRRSPHHPLLNNHSLSGQMNDFRSINITGNLRAHYIFEKNSRVVVFVRLGTHSELY